MTLRWLPCALLFALATFAAEPPPATRYLTDFGPVATPAEAAQTYETATAALLNAGGGVLLIPPGTAAAWQPENTSQAVWREPPPPAPATRWGSGPGLTLVDLRSGTVTVSVPQLSGIRLERHFSLPPGQSSPHWEYHPLLSLDNTILHGATSYREPLLEAVEPGVDRRFYMRTLRGLFPGMFLNSADAGQVNRLYLKTIGYDVVRQLPYFTADVTIPVAGGTYLHNKTHVNALRINTHAHSENQTFDLLNWRRQYSQGDAYLFDARFYYMGDVHSTGGDENGVLYAAFTVGESNIFRGEVAAWDSARGELVYRNARNAHTLGSGRPLINLNPARQITAGSCHVLHPGGAILGWSGQIRSTDAPWGPEVVGRYFAIDEPTEYVPGGDRVRRWWYITRFSEKDGVKSLSVQRNWWGAKDEHSISRLYRASHFTTDTQQPVPLRYIIAPGANAVDVSRGVRPGPQHAGGAAERLLVLAPGPHLGTAADFAPGDPIEQAIGPDPFRPVPFRAWLFDNVPGAWPAPVFDIANRGPISRPIVLHVHGGPGSLAECEQRADQSPPWGDVIRIESAANRGLVFEGDMQTAAIVFSQRYQRAQVMQWGYGQGRRTTLEVSPETGVMQVGGPGLAVPGGIQRAGGLSGDATPARNLRGKNLSVPEGAREFTVTLPTPEADADYAIFVEQNWLTERAIGSQTPTGFTVVFDRPAPATAKLHWMLVR